MNTSLLVFFDAVWMCRQGSFSSVALSNIANAGKQDCSGLYPSISNGKECIKENKTAGGQVWPQPQLQRKQIVLLSRLLLAQHSKKWVMHSSEACAVQLALARRCADSSDLRWPRKREGGRRLILEPIQDWP